MIKVIFFNPQTLNKRIYTFVVTWDSYNHMWSIEKSGWFGTSKMSVRCNPLNQINTFADCERRINEYVTIKGINNIKIKEVL